MAYQPHVIPLEGPVNARDLGGIPTADGRRLCPGRLLRSGRLARLTTQDDRLLREEYHLTAVLDLRTATEIERSPDPPMAGVTHQVIHLVPERTLGITREEKPALHLKTLAELPGLASIYPLLVSPDSYQAWRRIFGLFLQPRAGAVLWHCTAGKDRAGLTAAMLLFALDVPYDAVLADYLKTNDVCHVEADRVYREYLNAYGDEAAARKVRMMEMADKSYLDAALDAVTRQFGGVNGFLREVCGVGPAEREALRALYCAPCPA